MGQKINPVGFRLGVNRTWDSRWYADTADYGRLVHEDLKIRKAIKDQLKQAGISRIIIERPHKKCRVTIHTARPGVVIGKKGSDIETLRKELSKMVDGEVDPVEAWLEKYIMSPGGTLFVGLKRFALYAAIAAAVFSALTSACFLRCSLVTDLIGAEWMVRCGYFSRVASSVGSKRMRKS